jgi:FkbM family methyltransferase
MLPAAPTTASADRYGTYAFTGLAERCYRLAQSLGRGWLRFKLALVLRKIALHRRAVVDAEPLGFRCRFYPHENLGDRFALFLPRLFEDQEREFLSSYLRPGQVFVDIGANSGFYSLLAARCLQGRGTVLALEPNPRMYQRLMVNLQFNGCGEFVRALPVGVSDTAGEFALYFDPEQLGAATLVRSRSSGNSSVQVHCDTILSILTAHHVDRVDVLKIDVEGYESVPMNRFFEDAPRSLWPRVLLIETDEGIDLRGRGYSLMARTRSHNSIYVRRGE